MANTKVSELTAATAATTDDTLYIVDGSTSKKITFDNLQKSVDHTALANKGTNTHAQIDSALAALSADHSDADTTYTPLVLYNTDDTPPAANTVPIGTIYIKYTP